MGLNKLTALEVKRAKAVNEKGEPVASRRYSDGGGLYLEVTASGSKSWVFMWKRNGRRRCMGLGSANTIALLDARELAADARKAVLAGRDPISERNKERARAISFAEAAAQCRADIGAQWKAERYRQNWLSSLNIHAKSLANKMIGEITVDHVEQVMRPLWSNQPDLALRLRERIECILDWAKAKEYRDGENPARWKGNLKYRMGALPAKSERVEHMAALPYHEVPDFMSKLRATDDSLHRARALEFTILTAARSNETFWATWDEIDFVEKLWIIPKERMKKRREHVVPLSERAWQIIEGQHAIRSSHLIFPGVRDGRPMSNTQMLFALQRLGVAVTVHGFRSSFRDWAGDKTAFPRDLIEFALAHRVGDATEEAYRRNTAVERRRKLMEDWAGFCARPPQADNVIPMERKPIPGERQQL
jgi:integrase